MALVTTTEMFKKAYEGGYAIGAFNINNMEIIQAIAEAAEENKSPVIMQVSAGARKYAKHEYLMALAQAAVKDSGIDVALHLDHGADFDICKSCIDGGFTSVMIDGSKYSFEENIELTRNPDILAALGKDKKPGQLLCGFAMETQNLLDNAESKLRRKNCDMLVANSLRDKGAGFGTDTNIATLLFADGHREQPSIMSKADLADLILDRLLGMSRR